MDFREQVVVVTGGANGIGKGIARTYAQAGAKVVIADIDREQAEVLAGSENIEFIETDVKQEEATTRLFAEVKKRHGTLDILINNAGMSDFTPLFQLTVKAWEETMQTNLRSVFLCSREAAKLMKTNTHGGRIVNIASTRATMSEPDSEAYAATKGGVVALTHALAATLSEENITVNAISPGWIHTGDEELRDVDHRQHLSGRVGKPSDVARACLYLTERENNFVTGVEHIIDGGMTRKMIYEH
ncbi:SDR family NAD(P)-dependent oxidoreductase [Shouchella shacheensis]|uniref:SDR family NAD(P)-dependent oxidoreductase n=1 Tax=Shouchella shacheensis TaxID=1649580 RepID=UPI000A3DE516|nr:SDR family oxidoreductase [Shouchella shacheensis]